MWSASVGATDHRTSLIFEDGAIWIGTKQGSHGASGVHVINGRGGATRAVLPAGRGDVVGIAIDADTVYSSSSGGEVVATTKAGKVVFRTSVGAAIVTPPTVADARVFVGDAKGRVVAVDSKSGRVQWTRPIVTADTKQARPIGSGLAVADIDGDGKKEVVGGTEGGELFALAASGGDVAWQLHRSSALHAAPVLCDVDDDGKLEVIAGWADGDVAIFDGKGGKQVWSAHVEEDDGDPTGLLASPTPIPGGRLVVPTARWGNEDSVVLLGAHDRAYRAKQGSVAGAPVLGIITPGSAIVEAVVGTSMGDVISLDAWGQMSILAHVGGVIEAPIMIADLESNGLRELVVVNREGRLFALGVHATTPPLLGRARGNATTNDGVLPPIALGWHLP